MHSQLLAILLSPFVMISSVNIDRIVWPSDRAEAAAIPSACAGWYCDTRWLLVYVNAIFISIDWLIS